MLRSLQSDFTRWVLSSVENIGQGKLPVWELNKLETWKKEVLLIGQWRVTTRRNNIAIKSYGS